MCFNFPLLKTSVSTCLFLIGAGAPCKAELTAQVLESILLTHKDNVPVFSGSSSPSPNQISSTFASSHGSPVATDQAFTKEIIDAYGAGPSTKEDFQTSLQVLSDKKTDYGLSNSQFLSAVKSMTIAFMHKSDDKAELAEELPEVLFASLLPSAAEWGESGQSWIKSFARISVEAAYETNFSDQQVSTIARSFPTAVIRMLKEELDGLGKDQLVEIGIAAGIENSSLEPSVIELEDGAKQTLDRNTPNATMLYGGTSGFDPMKSLVLQQLAVGISEGFLNTSAQDGLSAEDFVRFTNSNEVPDSSNGGETTPSIVSSFVHGLLDSLTADTDIQSELFLYESLKSSANGFLLAATVAATSDPQYRVDELHLQAAETLSASLSQSAILHKAPGEQADDAPPSYSVEKDWFRADRVAESVATGSAMGSQLATVLPKSMEFTDSWELSTNVRREIAKAVANGSSSGAVSSSAWLSTLPDSSGEKTILEAKDVEEVSRGASLGAMMGNTGLAIYFPTDQLVPIINFTAQGSAAGSTGANNLSLVKTEKTEPIDVSLARQSSLGSALGSTFIPTTLLDLEPHLRKRDQKSIDHLEAASFGATYGAILGLSLNDESIDSKNGLSQFEEDRTVELKQAAKQGSIEGALAGAKLALGLDQSLSNENLKSKSEMLKAINAANAKAAANSKSAIVNNSLETNPQDMLLLMQKFGINPRFTNPAKMYKRPVVVQNDESPVDDNASQSIVNASPI